MAEAILWEFARLLDDFAKDGKLRVFGGEFDKLKKTVSFLQNIAHDAERRSLEDFQIARWLRDLKAAFYDAEDLLEGWTMEVMRPESPSKDEKSKKQVSTSISPSNPRALRLEMRGRARDIRERIEAIAAKGRGFNLRESAEDVRVGRGAWNRERSESFVYDEEEIIGRDDAKSAIMKFLLDSDTEEKFPVLSIWGESGIGKTALARCLYEDDTVKKHFDLRIWVCVGRDLLNLEGELRTIRERETTQGADDMEQLQKYLLVIDDLWSVDPERWRSLKSLLMGGAQGNKILITTRDQSVADLTGTTPSYCLEALPENSSLDLLMRMACEEEEETRDSIKLTVGRWIVKKCGGIPLAIRIIGSLLFFKKTALEWLRFEYEMSKFSADFRDLGSIVELSYIYLPSHLRQCFAFCSLFPKDSEIDKLMLTSLWMAEGFIRPIGNRDHDMEDIAHDYFMDLLRRNLFQDCTKDEFGKVTSCKMHDLMNDLARRVAGTEYKRIDVSLPLIEARTRHIALDSSLHLSRGYPNVLGANRVRTFIRNSKIRRLRCRIQMHEQTLHNFISCFKLLRALDWHDSAIEKLPSSICELKHLTFLDLSENEGIVRLPDSMTRMQTLQVLKLNMCYKLIELPSDIRKLVNLRQLEISNCKALSHMPHGLGQLTLLRTLTDFLLPGDDSCSKKYSGLGELSRLSNLRGSLRIEVKGQLKDAVANSNSANLKEKDYLVSLVLVFPGKESDDILLQELQPSLNLQSLEIRGYGGTRFPSWMSCLPKLVQLRLFDCAGCKILPSLGELTSLKHLEIGKLPMVEYTESDLNTLSSLPNLSTLKIWECPNLEWIPPLRHLKELKLPRFPLEPLQTLVATTEHVICIDDRVKDVIKLLEIEDDEVGPRIVGIHGTNGSGKTTIVKAVYNRLSSCFDHCSFLAEIGETTRNVGGIQFVQTKLICDVLEQDGDVASFEGGIKFFRDVFRTVKVLIVLDDVEEQSHLDDLVGDQLDWFGPGSRIIVTLENVGILQTYVSRGLARMYEVNEMDNYRALELFRKHAIGTHCSIPGYIEIGKRIVKATGQVPLVIEVIGSFLHGKTIEDWRKIEDLIKPQKENSQEILKDCREILKICYDALDEKQKQIFWDIAWFANGVDSRIASYMWPDRDLLPSHHVLMPLAKIGGDNMLWMHKLLKHLSRTMDQEPKYPGRRSRQYMHVTDLEVINRKEGMEEVEALCFDFKNLHLHSFTETDFKSMPSIRFLKLDHAKMTGNIANVFPKLRWLRWQGCPRDFEAAEFSLTELVILDLSWSKVTEDWGGWRKIKMEQLKVLNLTGCTDLLISPTFSSFPNLEILILERCSRLVHLDPSVGGLKKLLCLNLKSCTELNRLPAELGALKALKELLIDETSLRGIPLGGDSKKLETLSASNCLSLSFLPHSIEHLTSLSTLSVDNSKITKLPDGVGELVKLRRLSLRNCRWIQELPESIGQLGSSLEELDISGTGVSELPDSFGNLQRLRVLKMDYCFISEFPSFIWRLRSLEEIHASSCRNLEGEIPGDIRELINLRILTLRYSAISSLPPEIQHLSKLETLDILHCDMLPK
ncbi:putative disease resistance protein RGA3 [Syzygium oleosum]|uniref:putative disease resistance protein RGA3 n=1 Tax=Syzygium oleosum TaxID=219896 RepID=UPI0024B9FB82|nr:putative disease resistance protein RGA3 [Syzygium oleosum]